jgi:serine/threonine protein phosphatase 1
MQREKALPMIASIRQLFRAKAPRPAPAVPAGQRVYAIGDIHGRLDLLRVLADAIEADDRSRAYADTTIILLGDLVDRGPDSSGVIAFVRDWAARRKVRMIAGNHEEMFLDSFDNKDTLRHFLRHGGHETVMSYPVPAEEFNRASMSELQDLMRQHVPKADIALMRGMEDRIVIGDYLFVHAGIKPGAAVADQRVSDMRWIREPFLSSRQDHGHTVVHGHTITDDPDFRVNRIGIDTGAFASGKLTALALEGTARWVVETCETDGRLSTATRTAA